MLNVVMLSVITFNVVILTFAMLNVVMLSFVTFNLIILLCCYSVM